MDQNIIGDRIKELRKAKNLTQDDLAALMNSSRVQINQWETGAREISANRIIEFASALDTSCEFLLRGVTVEKADSFNQTGLNLHALNAFADIMELPEHKKKQCLAILNGILGSDCFWRIVLPSLTAALSIQENAVLGGAYAGLKDFNPQSMSDKIKESIQTITFSNTAGYTEHILLNKETAIAFKIQEAMDNFKLLLKAIIENHKDTLNNPLASYMEPYHSNRSPDEKITISTLLEYLKAMGITPEQ